MPAHGRPYHDDGYVLVKAPGHPMARVRGGWAREHAMVMAGLLGRPLVEGETVRHRNGIRDDNRPENLRLMVSDLHPKSQAVEDLHAFVREALSRYGPLASLLDP